MTRTNGKSGSNGQTPSARERSQHRREEIATQAGLQEGMTEARDEDPMADVDPEDLIDQLTEVEVGDEHSDVLEVLRPHLTSQLVTSYYDPDDRRAMKVANLARTKRIIKSRDRGRLCTGPFKEVAQDSYNRDDVKTKHRWTDEQRAVIRELAWRVRTSMQYLGIRGFALEKAADTKVETVTKHVDEGSGSDSRLARAQKKVFGP